MERTHILLSVLIFFIGCSQSIEPNLTQGSDVDDLEVGYDQFELDVWAPFADAVYVKGEFNNWQSPGLALAHEGAGQYRLDVEARTQSEYLLVIEKDGLFTEKADPRALMMTHSSAPSRFYKIPSPIPLQHPPTWNEMVIYEMHIGTFAAKNDSEHGFQVGTFDSAIGRMDELVDLGVNTLKVMPIAEFAGDISWGYNTAFPFAVESGYGGPEGFIRFVNAAHERGLAVLVDVVYNHWGPSDLSMWCFDEECLSDESGESAGGAYFYTDDRRESGWGPRPDYGRPEIRKLIVDNALMWMRDYQVDGLRFDSTINIRSSRVGEIPDGWYLLQEINNAVNQDWPGHLIVAEDLQKNPWVTQSTGAGGAGFDSQWDAGFVHPVRAILKEPDDSSRDLSMLEEALYHRYGDDAFKRVIYTESHDEVANGHARLPDEIDQFDPTSIYALKRSMLGGVLVMTTPGIPMIFQGQEMLEDEWFRDTVPLDWERKAAFPGIYHFYKDLVHLRTNADGRTTGLTGQHINIIHRNDSDKVLAFHRWKEGHGQDDVVVMLNLANRAYDSYSFHVPFGGRWSVRLNSDAKVYDTRFDDVGVQSIAARPTADGWMVDMPLGSYAAVILSRE